MDVTPSLAAYRAMEALIDATVGEAPAPIETSRAANQRREKRKSMFDWLHRFYALAMREGTGRYLKEHGAPTRANSRVHTVN